MPIPTNQKQPLFLYGTAADDGQYVDVDVAPNNILLARGIYCLTAVDVNVNYALDVDGSLDGTNGFHLPAGDTRMLVVKDPDGENFTVQLAPGGTTPGQLNIGKVQPVPGIF